MNQKTLNYIEFITGIRGVAILMVVLFHLCSRIFPNGFYGVDVFFVITGYLLFYTRKKDQRFSMGDFLKKKVIRIYPSLSVLILVAGLCMAPFLYETNAALAFGKSCLSSILGVSNFYYTDVYSDYFATDSNVNPLLHTWFLAVTIQVYLLWGAGSILLQNVSTRVRLFSVCLIALGSLMYCFSDSLQQMVIELGFVGWGQKAAVSYYDTLGRIWQVLAGGLVCVLPEMKHKWMNSTLFVLGLLILVSTGLYNQSLPVSFSVVVVVATVLILRYAGAARFPVLLENKFLLFIGKISFSLYLVHFPIFVFYRRWERLEPDFLWCVGLLAVSIAAAWLLWRYVESRKIGRIGGLTLFGFAMIMACLCRGAYKLGIQWDIRSIPYPVYHVSDEHIRVPDSVYAGYNEDLLMGDFGTAMLLGSGTADRAILSLSGKKENPEFVLVGNSVAQQLYAGFHEICKERNIPGVHITTIVYPLWNYRICMTGSYSWTERKAGAFLDWLRHQPDLHTVVVSYLWKAHEKDLSYTNWAGVSSKRTMASMLRDAREFCNQVKMAGKHVVIITPTPVFMEFEDKSQLGKAVDYVQWRKQRRKPIDEKNESDPFVISESEYMSFNADVYELLYQLEAEGCCKLLHIERGLFRDGNFAGLHNETLFCSDKTHITPAASVYVMQGVAAEFEELIRQNKLQYTSSSAKNEE